MEPLETVDEKGKGGGGTSLDVKSRRDGEGRSKRKMAGPCVAPASFPRALAALAAFS